MRATLLPALLLAALAAPAAAQRPDTTATLDAQRAALKAFDRCDGVWRGEARTMGPAGEHKVVHTERVGGFLDGTLKLIEGHSYNPDGSTGFHAFAVISYDAATKAYAFRSYAQGHAGTFAITPTDDGYVWETPAGPGATIRYTATITPTSWTEIGDRIVAGQPAQRIFEMHLTRVGGTDWPAAGGVPMK